VHRVYCALRLNLPRRAKRRVPVRLRQPLVAPTQLNEIWALDFMADALYDGRGFRTFNVLDEGDRAALAIEIGTSIPSARVIRILEDLIRLYGRPARVRVDNGPELTAEAFVNWCAAQRIAIGYIQPGKPDQNAFIERFNRSFREEVLDAYLFDSLEQVREITDAWLSRPTIPSGLMTASARCRRSSFCRGQTRPQSLSLKCLLDPEAYDPIPVGGSSHRRPASRRQGAQYPSTRYGVAVVCVGVRQMLHIRS